MLLAEAIIIAYLASITYIYKTDNVLPLALISTIQTVLKYVLNALAFAKLAHPSISVSVASQVI